jgi:predicted Zn-dependent peptidase
MQAMASYAMYGTKNPFNFVAPNEVVQKLTANQLIDRLHTLLQHDHTFLLSADMDSVEVKRFFNDRTQTAMESPEKLQPHVFKPQFVDKPVVYFCDFDMVQSEIRWIRNCTAFETHFIPRVNLFNSYFGGGMASVVFQTLRESKALAYSTYAVLNLPEKRDLPINMLAYIGCQSDKFHEAINGMDSLLNFIPNNEEVFQVSKEGLLKSMASKRLRNEEFLFEYERWKELGLRKGADSEEYNTIVQTSLAELKKQLAPLFSNKPFARCVLASKKKISAADLNRYGKVQILNTRMLLGY